MTTHTRRTALALLTVALMVLAACGSDSASSGAGNGELTVTDATIDVPANPSQAAVRMVIENGTDTDDELVSVTTSVADGSMLHESAMDDEGRATMEMLDGLPVPAGETVILEPGGLHVMLTGLTGDLAAGDTFDIDLTFVDSGTITVPVTVSAGSGAAEGDMEMDDMDHDADMGDTDDGSGDEDAS